MYEPVGDAYGASGRAEEADEPEGPEEGGGEPFWKAELDAHVNEPKSVV